MRKKTHNCGMACQRISVSAITVYVIVLGRYPVEGTTCGKNAYLPVFRFCSDDKFPDGNPVIFDGCYAESFVGAKNCTCVAKAKYKTAKKLKITHFGSGSKTSARECGSSVIFRQPSFDERSFGCQINHDVVEMNINDTVNITIEIILRQEFSAADTKYRFKMEIESANVLDITCTASNLTKTTTHDRFGQDYSTHGETYFDITAITNDFNDATATSKSMTTENASSYLGERRQNDDEESSKTLFIGIGCGAAGLLVLILSGICFAKRSREQKQLNRESDASQEGNDEYELQYNTLYVTGNDDYVNQHISNRHEEFNANVNQITFPIEGNCNGTDYKRMPKYSTNAESVLAIKETGTCDMNVNSDYLEIELDKQVLPAMSWKSDKHPKSNGPFVTGNESFVKDLHSTDKSDNLSTVRHVIAPRAGLCEYAVVARPNDDSCRNDVYAVVNKTREKI